jgi:hypothetical protein
VAQTQVVEGFGARDLATGFQRWWRDFIAQLDGTPRRPRRVPVKSDMETASRVARGIKDATPPAVRGDRPG